MRRTPRYYHNRWRFVYGINCRDRLDENMCLEWGRMISNRQNRLVCLTSSNRAKAIFSNMDFTKNCANRMGFYWAMAFYWAIWLYGRLVGLHDGMCGRMAQAGRSLQLVVVACWLLCKFNVCFDQNFLPSQVNFPSLVFLFPLSLNQSSCRIAAAQQEEQADPECARS